MSEDMEIRKRIGICLLGFILLAVGCRRSHPDTDNLESNGPALKGIPILTGSILQKVSPVYPPVAKAAGVEGTVILHAIIAADGSVESLDVISGPLMLRGAAVDAVKQWVYAPYMLNGVPRRVDTTVTVNFRFNNSSK
ncbi:energy transducer TonB [Granulicella pectinivorans]|jgi:protein TonB|nr:energy transducer TonB [Granulicella pectinivorans]